MFKVTQLFLNNLKTNNNKSIGIIRYDKYLKSTIAEAKSTQPSSLENDIQNDEVTKQSRYTRPQNSMVAAVFASLKPNVNFDEEIQTPLTDDKIKKAGSVDELLSISEGSGISRKHALKVVSTLAEWSSSGKIKVADFENDARFIKLCRILSRGAKISKSMVSRNEDLSTILSVTADDEAARLISSLNLSQMVKVMSTLTMRKRRSVLLLRTLAYNITANNEKLDLKQSADLLYSMCLLNFMDINLLTKICGEISMEINKEMTKSAAVGSIITSLGLLKYKDCEILDELSDWILKNHAMCRPQDIFSLFITLAMVDYSPSNSEELFQVLLPQMVMSEARKPSVWLNFVWSLVILNRASSSHISSVLTQDFVDKIEGDVSTSSKLKLLNINGAAQVLVENYVGDLLSPLSSIHDVNVVRTREKNELRDAVVDTLKNLIPVDNLRLDTNIFGCSIDVECLLDKKCSSLPFNRSVEAKNDITKVAILVYDYRDMCLGKIEPSGPNLLACRLLQSKNYKVLTVPYTEFKMTDKLVRRVQYLENKLKNIVK